MKRVLMVAYHFPPLAGSSGVQRALRFSRHLPDFGWEPVVLTAHPRAFERVSDDLLDQVGRGTRVIHAQAWDAKRHFALAGRYPAFLARPDRWRSWWLGAVPAGLLAIRRYMPDVIWSTYPIATAHAIGLTLSKTAKRPLVADFRDPMAQDGYPADPVTWQMFADIERRTISRARISTFTSPGAARVYENRYPSARARLRTLENGYDEETFDRLRPNGEALHPGRITLLHSGVVYPSERDPTCLFEALARGRRRRPSVFERIVVRFRAPVHEELLKELASRHDLMETIEILGAVSYREAIEEMLNADGLLILQARNCNEQIPAKLYEYLRANRPMIVLADPAGDTAKAAMRAGLTSVAALESSSDIESLLERFITSPTTLRTRPDAAAVESASRYERTRELAALLLEAASGAYDQTVTPP